VTFDPLAQISHHADALLRAADGNLGAQVEHCPGWTVEDLVRHIRSVNWFWATVVAERRQEPFDDRPSFESEDLLGSARAQAERLVSVLRAADPATPVWTWSSQRDVAFVLRHQVQEAAVHHFDAAHAAGLPWSMDAAAAADAVDEMLTFSLPGEGDLGGTLTLRAEDFGTSWTIGPGPTPGSLTWSREPGSPALTATAPELLLWLYERVELDTSGLPQDVLARFAEL